MGTCWGEHASRHARPIGPWPEEAFVETFLVAPIINTFVAFVQEFPAPRTGGVRLLIRYTP